jgi:hypothetical protein
MKSLEKEAEITDQKNYDGAIKQYFSLVEELPSIERFCTILQEHSSVSKENAENIREDISDDKIVASTNENKDMMVTTAKSQWVDDSLESFMKLKNNGM